MKQQRQQEFKSAGQFSYPRGWRGKGKRAWISLVAVAAASGGVLAQVMPAPDAARAADAAPAAPPGKSDRLQPAARNAGIAPPANGMRRLEVGWFALVGCTVYPSPGAAPLEAATVLVRDGRIVGVVPGKEVAPDNAEMAGDEMAKHYAVARTPLGPRVIQATGLHIYAGFIDPCVGVDVPAPLGDDSQLHWSGNVTPQRSALAAGLTEATAGVLRKNGFAAAAIAPKSGIFRGRASVVSLAKAAEDISDPRTGVYSEDVYQLIAMETGGQGGGRVAGAAWAGYPDSQMGAIALIRQTLSDGRWWASQRKRGGVSGASSVLDYIAPASDGAHAQFVPRYMLNAESELEVGRVLAIAAEFELAAMVLGSGQEYRRLGVLESANLQLVLPLNFPKPPDVSTLARQEATDIREMMAWEQSPTNPRRVHDAGVTFAFTTEKLKDKGDFLKNLRLAVRHGLAEETALAALTTVPARWLGLEGDLGIIAPGHIANMVVLDGPIFGNAPDGKPSKIRGVWIDGIWQEVVAAPIVAEGSWELSIPSDPRPIARRLEIDAENGVTIVRDGKRVKATRVVVEEGRLTFTFDHDALDGAEGICTMAATFDSTFQPLPGAAGPGKQGLVAPRMVGVGVSGTGKRYDWIAVKRADGIPGVWPLVPNAAGGDADVLSIDADGQPSLLRSGRWLVAERHEYDGDSLMLVAKDEAGSEITIKAKVQWSSDKGKRSATLRGITSTVDGASTPWKATRRASNPFTGAWIVTEYDGKVRGADEPPLRMQVGTDGVTLRFAKPEGEPTIIEASDVTFTLAPVKPASPAREEPVAKDAVANTPVAEAGFVLRFKHSLVKLGGVGESSDRAVILFGAKQDQLVGVATLPDGSKHDYKASRVDETVAGNASDRDEVGKDVPKFIKVPFGAYGLSEYPKAATHTILSNATIWTCDAAGKVNIIPLGYVYFKGGVIAQVAEGNPSISVPEGEQTTYVNLQGMHITPGIVDCHSHTGISGGVNESGQAVTAECRIADVTSPDPVAWYQQLAGGVTTVNTLHGSANSIGGQSQTNKVRWGVATAQGMHFEGAKPGIKFALGENPRRANSGGEGGRYPATRMGVEMQIRDRFTAAGEYAAALAKDPSTRRDLELEALAEVLDGRRIVHAHSYRQDEMVMLALVAKEFGFKIGTYQHALEGYKVADYVRDFSGGASGFADWWAYKVEVQDAIPQAFSIMHEQGAVASFNSDSNELARRLNVEAAKAVKYGGTSPVDALKFVTLYPAMQLKIDKRVGSLEPGKDADIAVWSGSPLSSLSRCEATYVDGRLLFSIQNDLQLREEITSERLRLIQKLLNENKKQEKAAADGKGNDAKPGEGKKGETEAAPGARPGGRRGPRPPQGMGTENDADGSQEVMTDEERAQRAILKRAFIERYLDGGHARNEQGVCGCGLIQEMHR